MAESEVAIIMGSSSDMGVAKKAAKVLAEHKVRYEMLSLIHI